MCCSIFQIVFDLSEFICFLPGPIKSLGVLILSSTLVNTVQKSRILFLRNRTFHFEWKQIRLLILSSAERERELDRHLRDEAGGFDRKEGPVTMGRWELADLLCLWGQRRSRGLYKLMGAAAAAACILLYLLAISAPSTWDTPIQQHLTPQEDDVWSVSEVRLRMREARLEMDKRLRRVEEVCRRYNLGLYRQSSETPSVKHPPTPQYSVFYIDKPHKISWCPIYKSASSTWLYNFLLLGGMKEESLKAPKEQLSVMARRIYPEPEYKDAEEAFGTTFKFMVVRHPFERLLSAYRDKLENSKEGLEHGVLHFYQKYGRHIVGKYRFNRTLADDSKERIEPTFSEFVRYLIDEDLVTRADDHWIPYYLFCTPCLLRYDAIAKVETMRRDQEYILRSAGLLGVEGIKPRWRHRTRGGKTTDDTAKAYFSQISEKQVLALYQKYSLDFDLFGYSPQKYLEYARNV